MSLIIIEGLDRTGKSSVAKYFEQKGYEYVHMSAPKDKSSDQYLGEMVDLLSSAASKNLVLDRSHYGELVWPQVYNRTSLLGEEEITILREIEDQVGVKRILMHDPQVDAHWKRCVDNNEPLTKPQFVKARSLYSSMAHKYGFELVTLPAFYKEFPDAAEVISIADPLANSSEANANSNGSNAVTPDVGPKVNASGFTAEQIKLQRANAINELLSKRILKQKGDAFDTLENELRAFLNSKLGQLLGGSTEQQFTKEEISFYKTMYKQAMQKEKR